MKMYKKLACLMAAVMIAGSLTACGGSKTEETKAPEAAPAAAAETEAAAAEEAPAASGEKITIRIGHNASEENIYEFACEAFRDKLYELVGEDRVEVQIYPNGTLGSQTEMIEMLQMGTLDAVAFGRHSQIDSRMECINLPFLFTSAEQQQKVLRGEEGAEIRAQIAELFEAQGIYMLGMFEAGNREITSTKPINGIGDLKGLMIRTPNTDVLMDSFEAWGASPTPMDINDLYTALQTDVVDAQENPYQLIYTNGYYEVCPYLCVTNHSTIPDEMQFSKKVLDSYPEDIQAAVREAGAYAANVAGEENVKRNNELLATLEGLVTVTYMPEADIAEMQKIVQEKVYPTFTSDEWSANLVAEIQALAD